MLRHNLLLIYRNFQRYKSTFLINLIGLSSGLCCVLLIYLWVHDELSMDKFHEKDAQLYRVMEHQAHAESIKTFDHTSGLLAEALAEDMPEIVYSTTVAPAEWFGDFMLSVGDSLNGNKIKAEGQFADEDFFQMFSYHLLEGEPEQVLRDKNAVVISQSLAKRLFGTTKNVVGRTLDWHLIQFHETVKVSGVFAGTPPHSSYQFEFVLPYQVFRDMASWVNEWGNTGPTAFLQLQEGTDIAAFNHKIKDYIKLKSANISNRTLFVRPYAEYYLYGSYSNGVQDGGRIEYVRLFAIIALFILMIACINFMNLSTARAARRSKEVGIKKAVGAGRSNLIIQYLSESVSMSLLSLLIAILLVGILLPQFNMITGKQLRLDYHLPLMLSLFGMSLFTGLLAGSYPALYLSGFKPAVVLKGKLNSSVGEIWARKGLVVFQFVLSIVLIVSVWVVYQQIAFVQNKNLGFDKEQLVMLPTEGRTATHTQSFFAEVKRIPGVVNVSGMNTALVGNESATVGLDWEGKNPDDIIQFQNFSVEYDAIETLGLEMQEGRSFSRDFSTDSTSIIFNEAAIEVMGLSDPVGKYVNLWGTERQIIGVVKNFHFESLHNQVKPLFFKLDNDTQSIIVKLEAGREKETLAQLQNLYQSFNPGYVFDYHFIDADYQALYAAEQRVSTLSKYFALLAILISCLGLFGLAAFTAERRLKEIGIRKILGATNYGIVRLLSGEFSKMVLTAILIALPLSYFIAQQWLDSFAFSIPLKWWYFLGAGLIALLIAWFTVGLQTLKAARINPVTCLKDE